MKIEVYETLSDFEEEFMHEVARLVNDAEDNPEARLKLHYIEILVKDEAAPKCACEFLKK